MRISPVLLWGIAWAASDLWRLPNGFADPWLPHEWHPLILAGVVFTSVVWGCAGATEVAPRDRNVTFAAWCISYLVALEMTRYLGLLYSGASGLRSAGVLHEMIGWGLAAGFAAGVSGAAGSFSGWLAQACYFGLGRLLAILAAMAGVTLLQVVLPGSSPVIHFLGWAMGMGLVGAAVAKLVPRKTKLALSAFRDREETTPGSSG